MVLAASSGSSERMSAAVPLTDANAWDEESRTSDAGACSGTSGSAGRAYRLPLLLPESLLFSVLPLLADPDPSVTGARTDLTRVEGRRREVVLLVFALPLRLVLALPSLALTSLPLSSPVAGLWVSRLTRSFARFRRSISLALSPPVE